MKDQIGITGLRNRKCMRLRVKQQGRITCAGTLYLQERDSDLGVE